MKWAFAPAGLALAVGLVAGGAFGMRINLTGSLPLGVYQVVEGNVQRGDLVLACPDLTEPLFEARSRGYLPYGVSCPGWFGSLIKYVAALPGDVVLATPDGISVNGRPMPNTSRVDTDCSGLPLPPLPASGPVAEGRVWLLSTYAGRSFDSRYWGPVPLSTLRGRVWPVWLFDGSLGGFPGLEGHVMEEVGSEGTNVQDETAAKQELDAKLEAFDVPGMVVEFDPDEAEQLGAFREDAMSLEDALEASSDEEEVT